MSKEINHRGLEKDLYSWICATKSRILKDTGFRLKNISGGSKIIPSFLMERFVKDHPKYANVGLKVFVLTMHGLKKKELIQMKRLRKAERPGPQGVHESQYKVMVSEKPWYSKSHDPKVPVVVPLEVGSVQSEFKAFSLEDTRKIVSGALSNPKVPLYYVLPVEASREAFEVIQNTVKSLGLFCRFKEEWNPKTGQNVVDKKILVFGSEV